MIPPYKVYVLQMKADQASQWRDTSPHFDSIVDGLQAIQRRERLAAKRGYKMEYQLIGRYSSEEVVGLKQIVFCQLCKIPTFSNECFWCERCHQLTCSKCLSGSSYTCYACNETNEVEDD